MVYTSYSIQLLCYRINIGLDQSDFNEIFDHYDKDKSGFIEEQELIALLKDILERDGPVSYIILLYFKFILSNHRDYFIPRNHLI